ncbi:futalosine hydrolase [Alteribacter natronophilus]|uniref:futalosine hydrolase n=1 Tax=Alteribacter natronophilus TaxID=2583810 RepID=UPI00110F2157|nr:futalosine hydrolase [Alteribacter natronophilus]TMW70122.1 futalosine hydrolase [Alteribacter natronophilus]
MNDLHSVLIITAVEGEKEAVERGLAGDSRFTVAAGGAGIAAAAAGTAKELGQKQFDLVINMGIGGGFSGRVKLGYTVVGSRSVAADLGAETAEGFVPVESLGFGTSSYPCSAEVAEKLNRAIPGASSGAILTLSTVTGTAETADRLASAYPDAVCEAMEGFGVAAAAEAFSVPFAELRTISNPVGPRDREAWKIKEAFAALTEAGAGIKEVL